MLDRCQENHGGIPGTHDLIPGLASVSNPSYAAAYTYAPDGLRLRVQESNNANPDRWMQYDGMRPVLEGTLSGDTFTTVNKYVWEGNSYYDPLVYALVGGSWRYYLYDGLGSTRQLMLHSDQSITDTYQYEAFGNLLSSTGTTPILARSRPPVGGRDRHGGAARPHLATYRYVGSLGYYQTGSSLMHLGARYYMPEVGRFLQRDRGLDLLLAPTATTGGSQYAYCGNAPASLVDPDGQIAILPIVIGIGRCLANRYCRAALMCGSHLFGDAAGSVLVDLRNRRPVDWCAAGCAGLCGCFSAGLTNLIPESWIVGILGGELASAVLGPTCTDLCCKLCK